MESCSKFLWVLIEILVLSMKMMIKQIVVCINISNEMHLYLGLYFKNSTCFGRSPCPSLGVTLLHRQRLVQHMSAGL
jgi:hypothetical protein